MKKVALIVLLLIAAGFFFFSYKDFKRNKKLDFSYVIGKEYTYINKNEKTNITLSFSEDGIFGSGGVNRYFAGYKSEGNDITFSPIGSTMMAGPQEEMEAERKYFDLLNKTNKIKVYRNKIILLTSDKNKLVFVENKLKNANIQPSTEEAIDKQDNTMISDTLPEDSEHIDNIEEVETPEQAITIDQTSENNK